MIVNFGTRLINPNDLKLNPNTYHGKHTLKRMKERNFGSFNQVKEDVKNGKAFKNPDFYDRMLVVNDRNKDGKLDPNDAIIIIKKNPDYPPELITVMNPYLNTWEYTRNGDLYDKRKHKLYKRIPEPKI